MHKVEIKVDIELLGMEARIVGFLQLGDGPQKSQNRLNTSLLGKMFLKEPTTSLLWFKKLPLSKNSV